MRQLDGEAKKTSASILKNLYESATSVKKQIHTDEPEDAPKETKEALVKKVQKPEVPHKEHIVEAEENDFDNPNTSLEELQNRVAELQAYLDDTPEVSEDERASIQVEINELLDEINYFENEEMFESLIEAENPENAEINKKILNTIKTKSDVEPKYKKDLEDAGFEVTNEFGNWYVKGPNGRDLSRNSITGGQYAKFNPEERKHADYYNYLTKPIDEDKKSAYFNNNRVNRTSKPVQQVEKYHKYNHDTHSWEPGLEYGNKIYTDRQKSTQGYDFNNLKNGSKDINDFKQSKEDERFHNKAQSWSQDDIKRANQRLSDFQASISDRIAELQKDIERAKEHYNSHVVGEENAIQKRKDILNKHRNKNNK